MSARVIHHDLTRHVLATLGALSAGQLRAALEETSYALDGVLADQAGDDPRALEVLTTLAAAVDAPGERPRLVGLWASDGSEWEMDPADPGRVRSGDEVFDRAEIETEHGLLSLVPVTKGDSE